MPGANVSRLVLTWESPIWSHDWLDWRTAKVLGQAGVDKGILSLRTFFN